MAYTYCVGLFIGLCSAAMGLRKSEWGGRVGGVGGNAVVMLEVRGLWTDRVVVM